MWPKQFSGSTVRSATLVIVYIFPTSQPYTPMGLGEDASVEHGSDWPKICGRNSMLYLLAKFIVWADFNAWRLVNRVWNKPVTWIADYRLARWAWAYTASAQWALLNKER
jgi:hypothetical protein